MPASVMCTLLGRSLEGPYGWGASKAKRAGKKKKVIYLPVYQGNLFSFADRAGNNVTEK